MPDRPDDDTVHPDPAAYSFRWSDNDPGEDDHLCEVDVRLADQRTLMLSIAVINGRFVVDKLTVRPTFWGERPDDNGIDTNTLRRLPFKDALDEVLRRYVDRQATLRSMRDQAPTDDHAEIDRRIDGVEGRSEDDISRGGRPPLPAEHYMKVARNYIRLEKVHGRGVSAALAREFPASRRNVRAWVDGATKRGFLLPGGKGVTRRLPGENYIPLEERGTS